MNDKKMLKTGFKEQMQARILSGALMPGTRLPSERELAEQMGISRGSVNQGILDLERMGFLRVVPRKGTYVADYMNRVTPQILSAIMSYDSALVDRELFRGLMGMRILIERECVRLACCNMTSENMHMLEQNTERIYSAAGEELVEALYEYHRSLTAICGNVAYLIIFQSFELMLHNMIRAHYENREELEKCLPMYEKLSKSIENRDSAAADEYISKILGHAAEYLNIMLGENAQGGTV